MARRSAFAAFYLWWDLAPGVAFQRQRRKGSSRDALPRYYQHPRRWTYLSALYWSGAAPSLVDLRAICLGAGFAALLVRSRANVAGACTSSEGPRPEEARNNRRGFRRCLRFLRHIENDPEPRLATHHPIVGFAYSRHRENFVHRFHIAERAEAKRILGINRGPGIPAFDRTRTANEQERIDLDGNTGAD